MEFPPGDWFIFEVVNFETAHPSGSCPAQVHPHLRDVAGGHRHPKEHDHLSVGGPPHHHHSKRDHGCWRGKQACREQDHSGQPEGPPGQVRHLSRHPVGCLCEWAGAPRDPATGATGSGLISNSQANLQEVIYIKKTVGQSHVNQVVVSVP